MEQLRAKVTLGSLTHVGMKRSNNQDAFCALAGANAPAGTDALIAVADGMEGVWAPVEGGPIVGYFCGVPDPDGNIVEFSHGQRLG